MPGVAGLGRAPREEPLATWPSARAPAVVPEAGGRLRSQGRQPGRRGGAGRGGREAPAPVRPGAVGSGTGTLPSGPDSGGAGPPSRHSPCGLGLASRPSGDRGPAREACEGTGSALAPRTASPRARGVVAGRRGRGEAPISRACSQVGRWGPPAGRGTVGAERRGRQRRRLLPITRRPWWARLRPAPSPSPRACRGLRVPPIGAPPTPTVPCDGVDY